ncbi:MAG: putative lipid II flippase FtsW [Alcaligenaceae bacterium]|nr:putative lipid II flippase FtsW [Alcaligenaceae bacterium]
MSLSMRDRFVREGEPGVNEVSPSRTKMLDYDLVLLGIIGAILVLGLIMVYSSSIAITEGPSNSIFRFNRYFMMQAIFIAVGFFGMFTVFNINMDKWEELSPYVYIAAVIFLVLVLIPFIGREVNGARRWIPLGPVNFQPTELAKMAIVLYTARYAVRNRHGIGNFSWSEGLVRGVLPIVALLVILAYLSYLEPDLGAAMVIASICIGILFLGGLHSFYLIGATSAAIAFVSFAVFTKPWRLKRMTAFLDPFSEEYAQSSGYQLVHSLIAIGRGEWTGVGLGFSVEKLHYLPEAHTDFILAVIGEELGFVGILTVVALYFVLVFKCFKIGRVAIAMDRFFSGLVAQGVGIWIGFQALFNLCVCLGLLPTKGLTLPMISYGGSAMVVSLCALGLVFRVDYENRQLMRGLPIHGMPAPRYM